MQVLEQRPVLRAGRRGHGAALRARLHHRQGRTPSRPRERPAALGQLERSRGARHVVRAAQRREASLSGGRDGLPQRLGARLARAAPRRRGLGQAHPRLDQRRHAARLSRQRQLPDLPHDGGEAHRRHEVQQPAAERPGAGAQPERRREPRRGARAGVGGIGRAGLLSAECATTRRRPRQLVEEERRFALSRSPCLRQGEESRRPEDGAPSSRPVAPRAQAAPTHARAPSAPLGSPLWLRACASGRPRVEEAPLSTAHQAPRATRR